MQRTICDGSCQDVFVGLDVHKSSWKTAIVTNAGERKPFTQPPRVEVLVRYLHREFPGARYHCVYEAGFSGFWIHDRLQEHGIECMVVNPADVPTTHKEHDRKTDQVDARKLARQLHTGTLTPIYVPSQQALEDRSLVRMRYAVVKKVARCKHQIKSLLNFYGVSLPEHVVNSYWSKRFFQRLELCHLSSPSGDKALHALLGELHYLRSTLLQVTKDIHALAMTERYRHSVVNLVSIPGVSTVVAMILLTELVTIDRFTDLDHLAGYVGLVPSEHSSGEQQRTTDITKRRNSLLRMVLVESAWISVRKDAALKAAFMTLCRRMAKQQAIVRIARKLLSRIYFVLKHQQPYVCQAA